MPIALLLGFTIKLYVKVSFIGDVLTYLTVSKILIQINFHEYYFFHNDPLHYKLFHTKKAHFYKPLEIRKYISTIGFMFEFLPTLGKFALVLCTNYFCFTNRLSIEINIFMCF